ncbi:MAG TPA: alcohol dehydrogenase [Burkholderiaceae bacterium]|nr:alcohol dehydrogenase [Burkholderiaceae bacterium]
MNELAAAMRSFVMTGFGEPLREHSAPRPEPTGSEVLLKVDACGVCHSDLHMWEGFFDLGQGRQLDLRPSIALPRALGHEIAGTVVAVGPDVRDARPGDRRVVFPWIGCGQCARCAAGEEHLCAAQRNLGTRRDGGFGSHVLVPHERYLIDFGSVREELACTYACSGLTAFSALNKATPLGPRDPLVIIGAGGLGLQAIGLARSVHGMAPIVAEIDRTKWDAALAAGAAQVLDPRDGEAVKRLVGETGGAAAAVDFVGAPSSVGFAMQTLRRGGRLVIVGLMGGSIELQLPLLPVRALSLIGSFVGSLGEMRALMALAREGRVPEIPVQTRPLHEAQRTLDDLKQGSVVGRVVLQP